MLCLLINLALELFCWGKELFCLEFIVFYGTAAAGLSKSVSFSTLICLSSVAKIKCFFVTLMADTRQPSSLI